MVKKRRQPVELTLRQLLNLGRSALDEAYFELQTLLDTGQEPVERWFASTGTVQSQLFVPAVTRESAKDLTRNRSFLEYTTSDVTLVRVRGPGETTSSGGAPVGVVDFKVTTQVRREAPYHRARLTMLERRYFRLAQDVGPFATSGRHVELSPTPVGTWFEEE